MRGETQLKLVKNGFTRWLTFDNVSKSLRLTFVSLILCLDELAAGGDGVADGLLKIICTHQFVKVLLLLRDILPLMAKTKAMWQSHGVDFVEVQNDLVTIKATLEKIREAPSEAPAEASASGQSTSQQSTSACDTERARKQSVYEFQCFDAFNDQLLRNNIELGNTRHRGESCSTD